LSYGQTRAYERSHGVVFRGLSQGSTSDVVEDNASPTLLTEPSI